MIPKIIHYCWFGRGEIPQLAQDCIASWHKYMPDWKYMLWNEESIVCFAQQTSAIDHEPSVIKTPSLKSEVRNPKTKDLKEVLSAMSLYAWEAYQAKKYAFVSDFVRLWALEMFGGLYLDVDFEVYMSFEPLMRNKAFAGIEGSKYNPVMMGVCASQPHGVWVSEQLKNYENRHFVKDDGSLDMTTNVQFISAKMRENGFVQNGVEQDYKDLHIFPVDYFSPRHTTGEYIKTKNTYCEHKGLGSWTAAKGGWKVAVRRLVGSQNMTRLIKLKRKIIG